MTQKENYPDVLEPIKNEDAERAVLGAVLIDGNVIESIGCILKPKDFDVTKHQKLFRTMCEMHGKGTPIDLVTLSNSLKENALFEEVGGYNYLTYITELTPASANCGHYAKIVIEYSNKRKLAEQLELITNDIRRGELDYETACSRLLDFELGENHNSKIKPIPAKQLEGSEPLSPLWGEIIYPECITQVNSEPGVGKSTFFYNLSCFGSMGKDFLGVGFSKRLKIAYVDIETPTWTEISIALTSPEITPPSPTTSVPLLSILPLIVPSSLVEAGEVIFPSKRQPSPIKVIMSLFIKSFPV